MISVGNMEALIAVTSFYVFEILCLWWWQFDQMGLNVGLDFLLQRVCWVKWVFGLCVVNLGDFGQYPSCLSTGLSLSPLWKSHVYIYHVQWYPHNLWGFTQPVFTMADSFCSALSVNSSSEFFISVTILFNSRTSTPFHCLISASLLKVCFYVNFIYLLFLCVFLR